MRLTGIALAVIGLAFCSAAVGLKFHERDWLFYANVVCIPVNAGLLLHHWRRRNEA